MYKLHLYDKTTPLFTLNGISTFGRVVGIIDGDTLSCVIPLLDRYYKFNFRLNGIDTCEMKSKNQSNKDLAIEARNMLFNLITNKHITNDTKNEVSILLNENVYLVWISCQNFDKFGRVLAKISLNESSESFSEILIKNKLAYEYHGDKKLSEKEQFELLIEEDDKYHLQ